MSLIVNEITVKSILSKSGIPGADYCINPYIGCSHKCKYCYASFMKKYTGHTELWGSFVDAKINAPEILRRQLKRAAKGNIIISSVTDPYQPLEGNYKLTRRCLEELLPYQFSVDILTKSPLVLRDIDIFKKFNKLEVGITITTDDERIRKVFEPEAPSLEARINTLKRLHESGLKTYVFIGPVLPMNPEVLCERIIRSVDYVFIDRMNYISKTEYIYSQLKLQRWLDKDFVGDIIRRLRKGFDKKDVTIC
jgi:DNA repair photolyase